MAHRTPSHTICGPGRTRPIALDSLFRINLKIIFLKQKAFKKMNE